MNPTPMVLLMLVAILVAAQDTSPFAPRPAVTRESIKAARDKFDREMKLETKRPWDGMDLTGPHAFEIPPKADDKK